MSGNLSSDRFQSTYKACRTQGFLFGEQRRTMAGNAWLYVDMLDVCDLGNLACHCTPSFTKQEYRFPDIGPQGLLNILQHNCV